MCRHSFSLPIEILPHRPPFLLIDRCISCDMRSVVCARTFSAEEPLIAGLGHRGAQPARVVPEVLLIEGLAQTMAYWALSHAPGRSLLLGGLRQVRFIAPVRCGEDVRFSLEIERHLLDVVVAAGTVGVGAEPRVSAKLQGYQQAQSGSGRRDG